MPPYSIQNIKLNYIQYIESGCVDIGLYRCQYIYLFTIIQCNYPCAEQSTTILNNYNTKLNLRKYNLFFNV